MGANASHSESQSNQQQNLASLSPLFPLLSSIFGLDTNINRKGNLAFANAKQPANTPDFGGALIGPEQVQSLGGLLNTIPTTSGAEFGFGEAGAMSADSVRSIMPALASTIPGLTRAASADPRNFFDPANALFQDTLNKEIFPGIRQGFGEDQFNSDIAFMQGDAGRRGALELAPWAVDSAFNTAVSAAPVLALMGTTMSQLPTSTAMDLFGLDQAGRASQRAATPGGSVADFLAMIQGLESPFGSVGKGSETSRTNSGGL